MYPLPSLMNAAVHESPEIQTRHSGVILELGASLHDWHVRIAAMIPDLHTAQR